MFLKNFEKRCKIRKDYVIKVRFSKETFKIELEILGKGNIESENDLDKVEYGVILGVAFAVIAIGIGVFMSLRRETSEK